MHPGRLAAVMHHNDPSRFSDREIIELGFYAMLVRLERLEALVATDFTEIQQDVAAQQGVVESAITLLEHIHQELEDAGTDQTALDNLKASIEANTSKLADAVAANQDPAPVDTPPVDTTPPPAETGTNPDGSPPPDQPTDGTGVADTPPPDAPPADVPPADVPPAEGDASAEAAPAE